MSAEPPLPPKSSRTPAPIRVGGGWGFLYAALAVAFAGTAIYLVVVRAAPVTSAQVVVAGVGALWFAARAAMSLAKRG